MKVAIIDDDSVFADALSKRISDDGAEVEAFESAKDLLETPRANNFDLYLVDLDMEDCVGEVWKFAGFDLVRKIRDAAGAEATIWVMTGHKNRFFETATRDNGGDRFIDKDSGIQFIAEAVAQAA